MAVGTVSWGTLPSSRTEGRGALRGGEEDQREHTGERSARGESGGGVGGSVETFSKRKDETRELSRRSGGGGGGMGPRSKQNLNPKSPIF